jgi:hypothetical protein
MKWKLLLVFVVLQANAVNGQRWGVKTLTNLLDFNYEKLERHLGKKGFVRNTFSTEGISLWQEEQLKGDTQVISRKVSYAAAEPTKSLVYQTSSSDEFDQLEKELKSSANFFAGTKPSIDSPAYFQSRGLSFKLWKEQPDSTIVYNVFVTQKTLPNRKDIIYAEDLLELNTNEYLNAVFGKENVKLDSLAFTKTVVKKCSVLYPNTSRQAIFIWNDETNLRDLSMVMFGQQLQNTTNTKAVRLSDWRSKQGVFCGMDLQQVVRLNKGPVSFYNWSSGIAGYLASKSQGALDFEKIKMVFGCMNCNFLPLNSEKEIIQSGYALQQNQRVYVVSFVVLADH